jgi:hypothetical protein
VELALETLSSDAYEYTIHWIRDHFTFAYGQQIDWSHDSHAVIGKISELTEERLQQLLKEYGVEPSRKVTIVWTYGDMGMKLPLYLVAQHIKDIWLPVLDDVFLLDPQDTWCMEFEHEGVFSCGH